MGRTLEWVWLLWPIVAGVICAAAAVLPRVILEKSGVLRLSLFDFIALEHGLHRGAVRLMFLVASAVLLISPGFRDYSVFFPETLRLMVFFDNPGIEDVFHSLDESDLERLAIDGTWKDRKRAYFIHINEELEAAGVPFRFREVPGQTVATGEVKIKVRIIDRWGAQLYKIVDAQGSLVHITQTPGTDQYKIVSEFELNNTPGSVIHGSLNDVFIHHGLIIMPEFKQTFRITPSRETYVNSVIAATRIDIFPYINLGNTLYLVRGENGRNFPIGYAVNITP